MLRLIPILIFSIILLTFSFFYKPTIKNKNEEVVKNTSVTFKEPKYKVSSLNVKYYMNTQGYFVQPEVEGNYPGVIMIHEWWGLNSHIKEMADQLASQGYRVLAVDLFGSVAQTPEEARKQVTSLNQNIALDNLKAAKAYLNSKGSTKIASLGWCFGGAQSLQISLNEDLDATVIYYGNLINDESKLKNLKSPVLGIFGNKDTSIPVDTVNNFRETLTRLSKTNDINIYDGVGHAFANPSGQGFAPKETSDAWNKTLNFLDKNLNE